MVLKFSSEMAGDSRFTWLSSSWSGTVTKSSIFNAMSFCRNYYVLLSFLSVIMMFFVLPVTHALQDLHRMPPSSWTYSDGSLPNPWREYTLFQVAHPCSYTYKLTKIEEFENSFSKKFLWNSIVKNRYKKKSARFLLVLQIRVYLFKMGRYCQQVYRSQKRPHLARKSAFFHSNSIILSPKVCFIRLFLDIWQILFIFAAKSWL